MVPVSLLIMATAQMNPSDRCGLLFLMLKFKAILLLDFVNFAADISSSIDSFGDGFSIEASESFDEPGGVILSVTWIGCFGLFSAGAVTACVVGSVLGAVTSASVGLSDRLSFCFVDSAGVDSASGLFEGSCAASE